MAYSAQVNQNVVKMVYGFGDATIRMVDKERTCLFHWTQSLDKHTKQLIKHELQSGHKAMCFEYKNATSLDEANTCYVAICYWWLSYDVTSKNGIHELENQLGYWHFRFRHK